MKNRRVRRTTAFNTGAGVCTPTDSVGRLNNNFAWACLRQHGQRAARLGLSAGLPNSTEQGTLTPLFYFEIRAYDWTDRRNHASIRYSNSPGAVTSRRQVTSAPLGDSAASAPECWRRARDQFLSAESRARFPIICNGMEASTGHFRRRAKSHQKEGTSVSNPHLKGRMPDEKEPGWFSTLYIESQSKEVYGFWNTNTCHGTMTVVCAHSLTLGLLLAYACAHVFWTIHY